MWRIHNDGILLSHLTNEVLMHGTTLLSLWALFHVKEKPKKQHFVWFHLYVLSRTDKSVVTWSRLVNCLVLGTRDGEWLLMGMGDDKCSKLRLLYNSVNLLKSIGLCTLTGWIVCYVNYVSMKFFLKEIKILISAHQEYMQGWSPVGVWNSGDRAAPKGSIWSSAWGVGEAVGVNQESRDSAGCQQWSCGNADPDNTAVFCKVRKKTDEKWAKR